MTDIVSREKRSQMMASVRTRDTKPELLVRSLVHRMGFRFRVHRKDLPGSPDIVLSKHRKVVFVHGCFWHRHPGCSATTSPKSNADFWEEKFLTNMARDQRCQEALKEMDWEVLVVWECETRTHENLKRKLEAFLQAKAA